MWWKTKTYGLLSLIEKTIQTIVYYETIKQELKTRPINVCRFDERLKTKPEESTLLTYTGLFGELEHLKTKTRDEVNRREVCECDGWVCVLEVIGTPSMFKFTRKTVSLTRVLPTFTLNWTEKSCLLWIDKTRTKDKTYFWMSVRWKTKN